MNNQNLTRQHFHTFDAFRFFAFLFVFLQHVPIDASNAFSYFTKSGYLGVSFFFALSGFLITYILLFEKMQRGSISFSKFFIRRALRIWPLFYAMILFAFITPYILDYFNLESSAAGYKPNWIVSMLFLENYHMMLTNSFPDTSPLRVMWSLCVEEHFYILWCILFLLIPVKRLPALIVICIIIGNTFKIIYNYWEIPSFDLFSNIDCFAFGAIPAYLLLVKPNVIKKVARIPMPLKYVVGGLTVICVFAIPNSNFGILSFATPLLLNSLFSFVILFTLSQTNCLYIDDKRLISKLGIYTYGLYMFHTIVINLLLRLSDRFNVADNYWIIAIAALFLTILVSIVSYHVFEKPFLKMKSLFG